MVAIVLSNHQPIAKTDFAKPRVVIRLLGKALLMVLDRIRQPLDLPESERKSFSYAAVKEER